MPGEKPSEHPIQGKPATREPLELVHHHPGRVRLRAAALVGDTVVAERIRQSLEGKPGIRKCVHNARTGSLLIEYEPALTDADSLVASVAQASGLGEPLSPREARRGRRSPARAVINVAREMDALTHELTGWRADLRFIAPATLAAAAAFSFVRNKPGGRLPNWDTLLWWSYNVFATLNQNEVEEAAQQLDAVIGQKSGASNTGR